MVSNKGYIKTLEAVVAIIIILIFVYILTPRTGNQLEVTPINIEESQRFILIEVALNSTFRGCIVNPGTQNGGCTSINSPNGCITAVDTFLDQNTPAGYESSCEVCDKAISCTGAQLPLDRSVFTDSVFIGATKSRVFRVYFWPKAQ